MHFSDKRVWITGASSGIGAALAVELADRGATCILSARTEARLEETRQRCRNADRHHVLPLDVTDIPSHKAAMQKAEQMAGPIDMVVLSAGISQRGLALETSAEVERRIMEVNFFGAVSLAKLAGQRMVERGSGHVVVVSSTLGRVSIPGSSAYSASKFALHGYFESFRSEVHPHGVGVTIVCPGYINTEITLHALQADGTPFGIIDHNHTYGMPADVCARKILKALASEKAVFLVGGKETGAVHLARFLPGLFRRLVRRYKRK